MLFATLIIAQLPAEWKGSIAARHRCRKAQDEMSQLRRENARLREENAILKKAAIFFAKETDGNTNSLT